MIQITPHMRILLAVDPVDFRKGIDGLAAVCRQKLQNDPFSGALFAFINKSRQAIRVLVYDGQGFWLCHKRLSKGRFSWWPKPKDTTLSTIAPHELQLLICNGDPQSAHVPPPWRPI